MTTPHISILLSFFLVLPLQTLLDHTDSICAGSSAGIDEHNAQSCSGGHLGDACAPACAREDGGGGGGWSEFFGGLVLNNLVLRGGCGEAHM